MSRYIYTYPDISQIKNCSFFEEIDGLIQITSTIGLRKSVNGAPLGALKSNLFTRAASEFDEILKKLCPEWNSPETLFRQNVIVSSFLREKATQSKTAYDKNYYLGFKRNSNTVVHAINQLEESCVHPDDIRAIASENKDVLTLCDIWDYMRSQDDSSFEMNNSYENLSDSTVLKEFLESCFGCFTDKKIVLHGFYYITPLQQRMFDYFELAGYDLIYLFPYNDRYPVAMEAWDIAYSPEKGYPPKGHWVMNASQEYNVFGEILSGNTVSADCAKIVKLSNEVEFARYIKSEKNKGRLIYSPNAQYANQILKAFYPEEFEDRRWLSYPVGKFLVALHSMWNEGTSSVMITMPLLRECFSSGWISINDVSSNRYMRELDKLEAYFSDCRTIDEWRNRLQLLNVIYDVIVTPAEEKNEGSRILKKHSSPLKAFSQFSIDRERLADVSSLIDSIIQLVYVLFEENNETNISKHMDKLLKFFNQEDVSDSLLEEETAVVDELLTAISRLRHKDYDCNIDDIANAIHFFLAGTLEKDEDSESGMVFLLSQVESAYVKRKNRTIDICNCELSNLPGEKKKAVWPLTVQLLENYVQNTGNKWLSLALDNLTLSPVYNRYYFFCAFNSSHVELSWIQYTGSKKNAQAPYLSMLEYCGAEKSDGQEIANIQKTETSEVSLYSLYEYDGINRLGEKLIKDAKMEYAVCPMRYLYGYILDELPSFSSEFHQNMAVGNLIAAANKLLTGINKKTVAKEIFELFPYLRDAEKRQIFDFVSTSTIDMSPDEFEGYELTEHRFNIAFPFNKLKDEAFEKYAYVASDNAQRPFNVFEPSEVKYACMYCPHEAYCRNTVFAFDQEDYYD